MKQPFSVISIVVLIVGPMMLGDYEWRGMSVVRGSIAEAQSAPFYQGKTIRLVVGTTTGGGYDRWARFFARYMPKYIPGNPDLIVQNMPGAAGMAAANYIYSVVKPCERAAGRVEADSQGPPRAGAPLCAGPAGTQGPLHGF